MRNSTGIMIPSALVYSQLSILPFLNLESLAAAAKVFGHESLSRMESFEEGCFLASTDDRHCRSLLGRFSGRERPTGQGVCSTLTETLHHLPRVGTQGTWHFGTWWKVIKICLVQRGKAMAILRLLPEGLEAGKLLPDGAQRCLRLTREGD